MIEGRRKNPLIQPSGQWGSITFTRESGKVRDVAVGTDAEALADTVFQGLDARRDAVVVNINTGECVYYFEGTGKAKMPHQYLEELGHVYNYVQFGWQRLKKEWEKIYG